MLTPLCDRASQRWQVYAAECSNAAEEIGGFEQ